MQVAELYEFAEWIEREVERASVVGKYQALRKALHQASQQGQQQEGYETQREDLLEALTNVPLNRLSSAQLAMLDKFGMADYLGNAGRDRVEDILYRNRLDAATAANKMAESAEAISGGIERAAAIRQGLSGCIDRPERKEDEIPFRIIFTGDASINDLSDFKQWGATWFQIVEGITRAHDLSQNRVRVVGAGSGSLILELAAQPEVIVITLGSVVLWGLEVAERVLRIRKEAAKVRNLDIEAGKSIADQLESEADGVKEAGAREITQRIIVTYNIAQEGDGDKVVHLESAVTKLLNFLDKGGEIDAWTPDVSEDGEPADIERYEELRDTFQEIRRLEGRVRRLTDERQSGGVSD